MIAASIFLVIPELLADDAKGSSPTTVNVDQQPQNLQSWVTHTVSTLAGGGCVLLVSRYFGFRLASQSQTDTQWKEMAVRNEARIESLEKQVDTKGQQQVELMARTYVLEKEHANCLQTSEAQSREIVSMKSKIAVLEANQCKVP
jgi:hypothetical protein